MNYSAMTTDLSCCLCSNAVENVSHIFGRCAFSSDILSDPCFALAGDWSCYQNGLFTTDGRRSPIKKHLAHLLLAVSVYFIWKERNDLMHVPGHALCPATIRLIIKRSIREKLSTNSLFKKAAEKDFSLVTALY